MKEIEIIGKKEIMKRTQKHWDNIKEDRILANEEVNKGLQIVKKINTTLNENKEMEDKEVSLINTYETQTGLFGV